MTILFVDSFAHYATVDIEKKWTSSDGLQNNLGVAIESSTPLRSDVPYINLKSGSAYVGKTFAFSNRFVFGARMRFNDLAMSSPRGIIMLVNGTTGLVECSITLTATGQISVWDKNYLSASVVGTTTFAVQEDVEAYIEFDILLGAGGAGHAIVRKNGVVGLNVASASIGVDYTASMVRYGTWTGLAGTTYQMCDLYIADGGDFLGDIRIDALFPIVDVDDDFTPSSGSDHYALVDESPPSTADYNDGTAIGNRDSYNFETVPPLSSAEIYGVQVVALMNKTDAGDKSAAVFAHSDATYADGVTQGIGVQPSYIHEVFALNPDGDVEWTEGTINAADFGVKVTA